MQKQKKLISTSNRRFNGFWSKGNVRYRVTRFAYGEVHAQKVDQLGNPVGAEVMKGTPSEVLSGFVKEGSGKPVVDYILAG